MYFKFNLIAYLFKMQVCHITPICLDCKSYFDRNSFIFRMLHNQQRILFETLNDTKLKEKDIKCNKHHNTRKQENIIETKMKPKKSKKKPNRLETKMHTFNIKYTRIEQIFSS